MIAIMDICQVQMENAIKYQWLQCVHLVRHLTIPKKDAKSTLVMKDKRFSQTFHVNIALNSKHNI